MPYCWCRFDSLPPLRGWARSWQIRVALRGYVGENQPKDPALTPLFCSIKGGRRGQDSPLQPGKLPNCSQHRVGLSQPGRREEAGTKKALEVSGHLLPSLIPTRLQSRACHCCVYLFTGALGSWACERGSGEPAWAWRSCQCSPQPCWVLTSAVSRELWEPTQPPNPQQDQSPNTEVKRTTL